MKVYETPYYIIHTDLDEESEKEAGQRMTKMAEEYHDRTKDFAGVIRGKFPFFLYRRVEDYVADGGLPGTAGMFMPEGDEGKLMAVAGEQLTQSTWHTVQHEGFHQFAHAVIGGRLPTWLDEGLAEYFGEGIFTGDGFVIGVVPTWRLKRLKKSIGSGKLLPIRQILLMSAAEWKAGLSIENYDEAWSMVHFLVHGDGGKYREALAGCVREISRGETFEKAWRDTLGPADGLEGRWKAYWLSQPSDPTAVLYCRATVSVLTSFLARAVEEKQKFGSFEEFGAAAKEGKLKMSAEDWLPASLLRRGLQWAGQGDRWELESDGGQLRIAVTMGDGTRVVGSYFIRGEKVERVEVKVVEGRP